MPDDTRNTATPDIREVSHTHTHTDDALDDSTVELPSIWNNSRCTPDDGSQLLLFLMGDKSCGNPEGGGGVEEWRWSGGYDQHARTHTHAQHTHALTHGTGRAGVRRYGGRSEQRSVSQTRERTDRSENVRQETPDSDVQTNRSQSRASQPINQPRTLH